MRGGGAGAPGVLGARARGARARTRRCSARRRGSVADAGRGRPDRRVARRGERRAREPAQSPSHGGARGREPREGSRASARAREGASARRARGASRSAPRSSTRPRRCAASAIAHRLAARRARREERARSASASSTRSGSASAGRRASVSRLEALAGERRAAHPRAPRAASRLREALAARAAAHDRSAASGSARRERESAASPRRAARSSRASLADAERSLAERLADEEQARAHRRGCARRLRDARRRRCASSKSEARSLRTQLAEHRERALPGRARAAASASCASAHLEAQVRDRWSVELASWKPPVPAAPGEAPEEALAGRGGRGEEGEGAEDAEAAEGEESEAREAARAARLQAEALAEDGPARRARLDDTRKSLEALGDVNLSAIEEHEELRERFRFLSEQKTDLENSIGALREAIAAHQPHEPQALPRDLRRGRTSSFQVNFPRLFRGGKAKLSLTEHEDVLEAGIEIMAQPPGKRLQSVNLLSGGEKTMTARRAARVASSRCSPSPFFLLDEVDAALDDANVGRFNEIVRELARDSQFLVITHNKRTIEIADLLYGVTMEEQGVSKLVACSSVSGGRPLRDAALELRYPPRARWISPSSVRSRRSSPGSTRTPRSSAIRSASPSSSSSRCSGGATSSRAPTAPALPAPAPAPAVGRGCPSRARSPSRRPSADPGRGPRAARRPTAPARAAARAAAAAPAPRAPRPHPRGLRRPHRPPARRAPRSTPRVLDELEALLLRRRPRRQDGGEPARAVREEARGRRRRAPCARVLRDAILEKLRRIEPRRAAGPRGRAPNAARGAGPRRERLRQDDDDRQARGALHARRAHAWCSAPATPSAPRRAEQLQIWGERADCEVVAGAAGGDPAAVAFDTVKAASRARRRRRDHRHRRAVSRPRRR